MRALGLVRARVPASSRDHSWPCPWDVAPSLEEPSFVVAPGPLLRVVPYRSPAERSLLQARSLQRAAELEPAQVLVQQPELVLPVVVELEALQVQAQVGLSRQAPTVAQRAIQRHPRRQPSPQQDQRAPQVSDPSSSWLPFALAPRHFVLPNAAWRHRHLHPESSAKLLRAHLQLQPSSQNAPPGFSRDTASRCRPTVRVAMDLAPAARAVPAAR